MYTIIEKSEQLDISIKSNTHNLIDIVPFELDNIVFSGGLLFECIKNTQIEELSDIDLFLFGSDNKKILTYIKLVSNLKSYCETNSLEYFIGFNQSVVYIFVRTIPRIIQLIFTDKDSAEQIIDNFDLLHLCSWYDGTNLYSHKKVSELIESNTSEINLNCKTPIKSNRLIKYQLKGLDLTKLLYQEYDFILNLNEYKKVSAYLRNNKFYQETSNITNTTMIEVFDIFGVKFLDDITEIKLNGKFEHYNGSNDSNNSNDSDKLNFGIDDDELKLFRTNAQLKNYFYDFEKQNYIFMNGKILEIQKENNITNCVLVEITDLRQKNYLISLYEEIIHQMKNKFNMKTNKFSTGFKNSLGHTFIPNKYIFQNGGIVIKLKYCKNKINLLVGENLNMIINPYFMATKHNEYYERLYQCFRILNVFN